MEGGRMRLRRSQRRSELEGSEGHVALRGFPVAIGVSFAAIGAIRPLRCTWEYADPFGRAS